MEWIPNQPVYFGDEYTCTDDEVPPQLVHNTDKTQFQLLAEPCPDAIQQMPDPNFSDPDSFVMNDGWTIEDNLLCCTGDSNQGTSSVFQFDETEYYQVNITVVSISAGASFRVSLGITVLGYITSTGTYTFYGYPAAFFGSTSVIITPEVEGASMCISEITAYEVATNLIVAVYNEQGDYISSVGYETNQDSFVLSKNTMTVTIDWAAMGAINGCYYLCLLNPCDNTGGQNYPAVVRNPNFALYVGDGTTPDWLLGDDWTNNPPMTGVYYLGGNLYQRNVFPDYGNYCISVSFQNLVGSFNVMFGDNVVGTITAGDPSPAIITGMPSGDLNLFFVMNPASIVELTEVTACSIEPEDYVCNSTSNMFKVGDYEGKCTLIINACNNEDGLGFVFDGSGFTPRVRLEAKLRQAKYENERSTYKDSVGKKSVYFFSGRKQKNLCVDQQPEYIHDFLRLLLGFDNVYIGGKPYVVDDDEYTVEYSEVSDIIGKVRLLVTEKTQDLKNTNCSDTENVCTLEDNYLLRADDPTSFVTQVNGSKIIIR